MLGAIFEFGSRWAEKAMNKALWEFSNTYQRFVTLRRFLEAISIVLKFLLGNLWGRIRGSNLNSGERIRLLIEKLGPTYIKFGQILSPRTECPSWLRDELKKLQDKVPLQL